MVCTHGVLMGSPLGAHLNLVQLQDQVLKVLFSDRSALPCNNSA